MAVLIWARIICQQQKHLIQFFRDYRRRSGNLYNFHSISAKNLLDYDCTMFWRYILYPTDEQFLRKSWIVHHALPQTQTGHYDYLCKLLFYYYNLRNRSITPQLTEESLIIFESVLLSYRLYTLNIRFSFLPYSILTDTVIVGLPFVHGWRTDHVKPLS